MDIYGPLTFAYTAYALLQTKKNSYNLLFFLRKTYTQECLTFKTRLKGEGVVFLLPVFWLLQQPNNQ